MDYLFWRLPKNQDYSFFPWILWYLWKSRNDKIYNNRLGSPFDIIRMAEIEGQLWAEAQKEVAVSTFTTAGPIYPISNSGNLCFVDGAWKDEDSFTGQGWFYKEGNSGDVMMRSMNIRRSLSPLHAECEALIWAMECMKTLRISDVKFATDCSQLVKMVSTPKEWPAFSTHMEEFARCKSYFEHFHIQYIPRAHNKMADKLARGARKMPSAMVYVDSVLQRWLSDETDL